MKQNLKKKIVNRTKMNLLGPQNWENRKIAWLFKENNLEDLKEI